MGRIQVKPALEQLTKRPAAFVQMDLRIAFFSRNSFLFDHRDVIPQSVCRKSLPHSLPHSRLEVFQTLLVFVGIGQATGAEV